MATCCTECGKRTGGKPINLECCACYQLYNAKRLKITDEQFQQLLEDHEEEWWCPFCYWKLNLGNPSTSARDTDRNLDEMDDVNSDNIYMVVRKLTAEIRCLKMNLRELENERSVPDSIKSDLEELKAEYAIYFSQDFKNAVEEAKRETFYLKLAVFNIQRNLQFTEQISMLNDVELVGVPEHEGEDLTDIVMLTAQKIDADLSPEDISHVNRSGLRQRPFDANEPPFPRNIVVRFFRRKNRNDFLNAAKRNRYITTEDIVDDEPRPLFINERLNKFNRLLFHDTRILAKECNYQFCWVRNGHIYVRKDVNAPAVRIQTFLDLQNKLERPEPDD